MLDPSLEPGLRALVERDLAFDALVHPRHLSRLLELLVRHPDLRAVVDHGAKPEIAAGRFEGWAADLALLARETSACCKLSGLVTEASPGWTPEDLRPYVMHLLECFGPERLLWGSDWPVVKLAGGLERWWATTDELLTELGADERAAILGGTAARFYRLDSD
jgi:L-fuconolactonase